MDKKTPQNAVGAIPAFEFLVAAIVLLLLEAFLLFNFFVRPQMAAASDARDELTAQRIALQRYHAEKQDAAGLAGQLTVLESLIGEAELKLPPVLHNEEITILIGRFALEQNITIDSMSFHERQLIAASEYISGVGSAGAGGTGGGSAGAGGTGGGSAGAGGTGGGDNGPSGQSALYDEAPQTGRNLSLQGVQISFSSEFHTLGPFIKSFEDSERRVKVKNVSISRVQEGELKGVLNLEFAALSPTAEQNYPGLYNAGTPASELNKGSLFNKYSGFIEDNVDPTILLLSAEDEFDPDFYILLKASTSNETKISYGVYPRVETELRSNVNNAVRAKLTISGDEGQFDYVYSLASYQKSERRTLTAEDGKLRLKVLSCQRMGDNDNVAILLDVDNNTELPFEIIVVNDDVLSPRFHLGMTKGNVNVVSK